MAFLEQAENGDYYIVKRKGNKPKAKGRVPSIRRIFLLKHTMNLQYLTIPKKLHGKRVKIKLEFVDEEDSNDNS